MRQFLTKLKSDESLILAYQRGDSGAFEVLYMRHKDRLFAFLYHNCQQYAVIEELAQDTWTAIIKHIARYQPRAKFKTYLYQIAHHKLLDHWRQHATILQRAHLAENCEQSAANDEHTLEKEQLQQHINHALTKLPLEQRDVFLLREEGFSRQDIATITGTSTETVKSRLRYATHQLRTLLRAANG
ncbi:sigma-70 family RNA polymerase sigma factor [bacterium AH-315-K03]|nr:sigma-70 family RNA polymerase sigma factor [bacterium AH-315-K03]